MNTAQHAPSLPLNSLITKVMPAKMLPEEVLLNKAQFQQALDPTRPARLLSDPHLAKRAPDLLYEYTDTGESVLVPNVWYNQTREMRAEYWEWVLADLRGQVTRAKAELKRIEDFGAESSSNEAVLYRHFTSFLQSQEPLLARCETSILAMVNGGPLL